MSPKFILLALGVLTVGTFLWENASAWPLDKDDSELDDLNSDVSSVDIDELPEDNKDDDSDDAIDKVADDVNDSEVVEYDEELDGEPDEKTEENEIPDEVTESEEDQDTEIKDSDEEETDKDEEDSEESSNEEDDDEAKQDTNDDKIEGNREGKVRFVDDDGDDYVRIVTVLDDDSEKESKSASWYEKIKKYLASKFGYKN